ncbi:MAG: DsbC family protein [Rhodoferax sp.]|jgi:thiol:disulfide interchange protein DsbC|uniref:DsbC family protein n=1 Tax=Rhodoferax sp. TaxID=50421 RepID=UPI001B5DE4B3|nr:DsbC family protein [Rhodoferax sp.]MBP8287612.1 DsbC family protein [Rhodoferax sp.]MBP9735350.1 DsbC family protein [Rhodoferax sp.]
MKTILTAVLSTLLLTTTGLQAQEAVIRKNLAERIPQLEKIDEVSKSPVEGLFEVRVNGADIYYTDAQANYLIQGNLIDTKQRRNLTEERVDKLTAFVFEDLPLKDAFTVVRGNGKRKLAVFEDPNCGYCKRFEEGLQKVNNVTIHMFLYPVLGPKSVETSKNIWCAKDRAKAWQDWMLNDVDPATAKCDTQAVDRNIKLGKKYRVTGTPTLVFADGSRVPGAIGAEQVEQRLTLVTSTK